MAKGERAGKYWFSPDLPEEVKSSIKAILVENEFLIPTWCNEVRIFWDAEGDEDGSALYIDTSYSYRYASIHICPYYLSEEEEDRQIRVKHELCHIVSAPVIEYLQNTVKILGKDDAVAELVEKESTEKVESMTEDLVYVLLQMEQYYSTKNTKK